MRPASIDAPGDGVEEYGYEVFARLRGCNSVTTSFTVMIGGSPELGIAGRGTVTEASAQICIGGVDGRFGGIEYVSQPFGFSVERLNVVSPEEGGSSSVFVLLPSEEERIDPIALERPGSCKGDCGIFACGWVR